MLKGKDAFKQRQLAAMNMMAEASSSRAASAGTGSRSSGGEPKAKKAKPSGKSHTSGSSLAAMKNRARHYELDRYMSNRFAVLTKIVKYLKQRFHEGLLEPLCIEDLLEEAHLVDTPSVVRGWLTSEALPSNPKVETIQKNGTRCFIFRPRYPKVRDRNSLINLLDSKADEGEGGVLLEDLQESAPNADQLIRSLTESGDAVAIPLGNQKRFSTQTRPDGTGNGESSTTTRQQNMVIFANQRQYGLHGVDEKLIAMWRAIEPGGAEVAAAISGEVAGGKRVKGRRGRPPSKKTGADGVPSFRQTNVHLANTGVLMNFS